MLTAMQPKPAFKHAIHGKLVYGNSRSNLSL